MQNNQLPLAKVPIELKDELTLTSMHYSYTHENKNLRRSSPDLVVCTQVNLSLLWTNSLLISLFLGLYGSISPPNSIPATTFAEDQGKSMVAQIVDVVGPSGLERWVVKHFHSSVSQSFSFHACEELP